MTDKIEKIEGNKLVVRSEVFHNYLEQHGIPVDNIIPNTKERLIIENDIEDFLYEIPSEVKAYARYLSKFICATSIGLRVFSLKNHLIYQLRS